MAARELVDILPQALYDEQLAIVGWSIGGKAAPVGPVADDGYFYYKGGHVWDFTPDGEYTRTHVDAFTEQTFRTIIGQTDRENEFYLKILGQLTSGITRYGPSHILPPGELIKPIGVQEPFYEGNRRRSVQYSPPDVPPRRAGVDTQIRWGGGGDDIFFDVVPPSRGGHMKSIPRTAGQRAAFEVLGAALDWSSEMAEYWAILREEFGILPSATNREALLFMAQNFDSADWSEIARRFASNIIFDRILGPILGELGSGARRSLGLTTSTMP